MKGIETERGRGGVLPDGSIILWTEYKCRDDNGDTDREKAASLPGRRYRKTPEPHWRVPATPACWEQVKPRWPDAAEAAIEEDEGARILEDLLENREETRKRCARGQEMIDERPIEELATYPYDTLPRRHQVAATQFAARMDSCLLDCWMGAGKTKMALDAVRERESETILVVCPCSVIEVWEDEIEKHARDVFTTLPLYGGDGSPSIAERAEALEDYLDMADRPLLAILNYRATWDDPMNEVILGEGWDSLIFDECHRLKSPGSNQSKFAKKIPADHVVGLTGTPMPHSPLDVYGQYRTFDIGIFGSRFAKFRSRYAVMGGYEGKQILGFQNEEQLRQKMDRIRWYIPEDALEMPDMQVLDRTCALTGKAERIYEQMDELLHAQVEEGTVTAANALSRLLRLQQIAAGYLPVEKDVSDEDPEKLDVASILEPEEEQVEEVEVEVSTAKKKLLRELLEDLYPERVVVFARFRHDLDTIHTTADRAGYDSLEISGRDREYREWQGGDRHDGTAIAVQMQAGSLGIDLTAARYAIVYTSGFSLGDYQQALARVHRPGQDEHVTVYRLLVKATIDRKIARALDKREQVIDRILSDWR